MLKKYIDDLKSEFREYNANKFRQDLFAGLTVATVALPFALAFGISCGASAAAGMVAAIVAGIVIGALAGGSFQISGPTGAMTAILFLVVQKYGMEGIWIAGTLAGAILIVAGVLKFGKLVSFLPATVITGFTSGFALMIAIGQLDSFLGVTTPAADSAALKLIQYFSVPLHPNWYSVLTGGLVIALMLLWPKRWNKIMPSAFAALIAVSSLAIVFKLPLDTIGQIPHTIIPEERLFFDAISLSALREMAGPALSIAALCVIESLLCGEVAAKMKGEKYDPNRDLVALGVGNMIIPFFGGIPVASVVARTSVGIKAGGITRLVSTIHALGLLASILFLAPIIEKIPVCVLSGILMVAAWRMNTWPEIRYMFSRRFKRPAANFLVTIIATMVLDLTQAIVVGVIGAVFLFVIRVSRIDINVHEVDRRQLFEKTGINLEKPLDDVRVAYFSGPLFFVTAPKMTQRFMDFNDARVLIISMEGVAFMDLSAIQALDRLYDQLAQKECRVLICGLQPQVENLLRQSHIVEKIGEDSVFWSTDQAILAAAALTHG